MGIEERIQMCSISQDQTSPLGQANLPASKLPDL